MIKMTADDDSYSLYDSVSVSATDLTVGTTNANTATATATDIDGSSCDPNNAFYRQLQIGRAVLWYLLLIYIMKSSVHPLFVPASPRSVRFYFWFPSTLQVHLSSSNKDSFCCSISYIIIDDTTTNIIRLLIQF